MKRTKRRWIKKRVACALAVLAVLVLQTTTPVQAAVTLGPTNPSNFKEGNESQSRRPATGFRFSQLARNFTTHIVQQTENRQGRKIRK